MSQVHAPGARQGQAGPASQHAYATPVNLGLCPTCDRPRPHVLGEQNDCDRCEGRGVVYRHDYSAETCPVVACDEGKVSTCECWEEGYMTTTARVEWYAEVVS